MSELQVHVLTANRPPQVTRLTAEDDRWAEQLAANEEATATAAEDGKAASTIRIAANGLVSNDRYPLELDVVIGALATCMIAACFLFFTRVWPKLLLLEQQMFQLEQPEPRVEGSLIVGLDSNIASMWCLACTTRHRIPFTACKYLFSNSVRLGRTARQETPPPKRNSVPMVVISADGAAKMAFGRLAMQFFFLVFP